MRLLDFFIRISLQGGRAARELQDILRKSNAAKAGMNQAGASASRFSSRLSGMARQANSANTALMRLARSSRLRFGAGMQTSFGGIGVGGSAMGVLGTGAIAGGVSAAANYEETLNQISVMQRMSAQETQAFSNRLRALSRDLNVAPTQIAALSAEIMRAGVSAQDSLEVTRAWAQAVSIGGKARDLVSNAEQFGQVTHMLQQQFGLTGDELTTAIGQITYAANSSTLSVTDFVQSLGTMGNAMASQGRSFQETIAMAILATRAGTSARDQGTSIKTLMSGRLADPNVVSLLRDNGVRVYDASGQARDIGLIINELRNLNSTMTDEQRAEFVRKAGGSDAGRMITAMMQMPANEFDSIMAAIDPNAARRMQEDYARRQQTMIAGARALNAAFEDFWISLGSDAEAASAIRETLLLIADGIKAVALWVRDNKDAIREWGPIILKAIGVLFVLGKVIGFLMPLFQLGRFIGFARIWTFLTSVFSRFAWVLRVVWVAAGYLIALLATLLGIPAWAAAAILAGIAALAYGIYAYWDEIKAYASSAWEWIKSAASSAWDGISSAASSAWTSIKDAAWNAVSSMFGWLSDLGTRLSNAASGLRGYAAEFGRVLSSNPTLALNPTGLAFAGGRAAMPLFAPGTGNGRGTTINNYGGNRTTVNNNGNGDAYLRRVVGQGVRGGQQRTRDTRNGGR
jgi:TP901 family phage tail tape measure protein